MSDSFPSSPWALENNSDPTLADGVAILRHSVLAESLSTANVAACRVFRPLSETLTSAMWPTIASPPRSLHEGCETERPLISLVGVMSEVSDTQNGGYYGGDRHSPIKLQFTVSEYVDTEAPSDSAIFSGLQESLTRTSRPHYLRSSPISRAFHSGDNISHQGHCIQLDNPRDEQTSQYRTYCQTFSTIPSPIFASPSPSVSLFDGGLTPGSFSIRQKFRMRGRGGENLTKTQNLASTDASPRGSTSFLAPSVSPTHSTWPESVPCSPVTTTAPIRIFRHQRLESSTTISSVASWPSTATRHRSRGLEIPNFVCLPDKLSWLKDVTLELWIDQEGFRAIRAPFRLVGYSELPRSLEPFGHDTDLAVRANETPSRLYAGIVDFIPVKRQIFIFHRSTLDSSPILRRITVDGDEGRDYLSRHASLTLKNGVYTVCGHETSSLPYPTDGADITIAEVDINTKFGWKLEYLVRDRRADVTGKIMSGEKTLTPLSFSCSPLLLHSLQAKKVRLMHVVKKSVTTNILAKKLEPPTCPISDSFLLASKRKTSSKPTPIAGYPSKQPAWTSHRRVYSHVVDENIPPETMTLTSGQYDQLNTKPVRKRRASSAEEHTSRSRAFKDRSVVPGVPWAARTIPPQFHVEFAA